jgi:hypothetical protein
LPAILAQPASVFSNTSDRKSSASAKLHELLRGMETRRRAHDTTHHDTGLTSSVTILSFLFFSVLHDADSLNTPEDIMRVLDGLLERFRQADLFPSVIKQLCVQIFYWLDISLFNYLAKTDVRHCLFLSFFVLFVLILFLFVFVWVLTTGSVHTYTTESVHVR